MHNLFAIFAKFLNICKQVSGNLVNEFPEEVLSHNSPILEVIAFNMTSEAMGIDSESLLFAKLQKYRKEIPNLISYRQYNDRRKKTSFLCDAVRERIVKETDGSENYFYLDSKAILRRHLQLGTVLHREYTYRGCNTEEDTNKIELRKC